MRKIIRGDQCEYAPYDPATRKSISACSNRHLSGNPPAQLITIKWDRKEKIVCIPHAKLLIGVKNIEDLEDNTIRRRRRRRREEADQLEML